MTESSRIGLSGEFRDGKHVLSARVDYDGRDFTEVVDHASDLRVMERGGLPTLPRGPGQFPLFAQGKNEDS